MADGLDTKDTKARSTRKKNKLVSCLLRDLRFFVIFVLAAQRPWHAWQRDSEA
jgi:hypothetical protein